MSATTMRVAPGMTVSPSCTATTVTEPSRGDVTRTASPPPGGSTRASACPFPTRSPTTMRCSLTVPPASDPTALCDTGLTTPRIEMATGNAGQPGPGHAAVEVAAVPPAAQLPGAVPKARADPATTRPIASDTIRYARDRRTRGAFIGVPYREGC